MQLPLRFSSSQTVRNLQGLGVLWSYLHMSTIWGVNVSRCSSTRGQAGTICHNKTTWWISSCSFWWMPVNPFWLKFIGENNSNIDVSLRWFPSSYVLFNHWWAAKVRKSHRVCTKSGQPATPSLGLEMMFEQDRQIDSTWHIYAVSMRCIYIYYMYIYIFMSTNIPWSCHADPLSPSLACKWVWRCLTRMVFIASTSSPAPPVNSTAAAVGFVAISTWTEKPRPWIRLKR